LILSLLLMTAPLMALDPHTKITDLVHTKWSGGDVPFTSVMDIAQTKDGTLWVATLDGLFRFDGIRFSRFDALSRTRIRNMLVTRDGSLWVVFDSGSVSHMSDGRIRTFTLDELPRTNALAEDRDGSIMAATANGGLSRFREGRWREAAKALHHSARRSLALWFDKEGVLWLQTEDHLLTLPPGEDHFTDPGIHSHPSRLFASLFAQLPDGTVWFADPNAAHSIQPPAQETRVRLPANILAADHNGSLWIGSEGDGLWRIPVPGAIAGESIAQSGPAVEQFTTKDGLSGNSVRRVFEDRESNIWIATDLGIDRFREGVFHRVAVPDADRISDLKPLNDGGLLLKISDRPYIHRVEPDGRIATLRLPGPAFDTCRDTDGTIWVATSSGFGRATGTEVSYPPQPPLKLIYQITCGYSDLWIADRAKGMFRFSAGTATGISGINAVVTAFFVEAPGRLWAAHPDGRISFYDNGSIREFGAKDGVPEGGPASIARTADGDIWFSGEAGLTRFRGGRFKHVDVTPGYSQQELEPGAGTFLWIRASRLLVRIDTREFDRALTDQKYRPVLVTYGALDGIPGVVRRIARSGGRLWVATSEGLGYLNLNPYTSRNPLPPPVQIETVTADGKTMTASQGMALPKLTHNLRIDYTAFSLTIPERVQFRYKLEGVDQDWQETTTRRQAYYTDLAPKEYRFLLRASNNDGIWNDVGAALDFSVAPAFYQTGWFQAAYVAAFLALLWLLYQYRLGQIARQFNVRLEERLGERTRIARELHDTLLQSFQGSLFEFQAARNLFVRRPEDAMRTLDEAIGSARAAIAEGREAIQNLRSRSATPDDLACLLRAAGKELSDGQESKGGAGFRLTVEGSPQTLSPVLQDEIYRIGREILRNAFHHARAKQIEVEIRYDTREFRLRIRDDGMGIDPKVLSEGARPGHWGLPGVRERAKLVAAKLDFWSEEGAGTEVQLTVPASVAYAKPRDGRVFGLFRRTRSHAE
jgi:signal transduction histidine kinase/ligand-binding sensor domain-containing protein